jgi:hypothetical protein
MRSALEVRCDQIIKAKFAFLLRNAKNVRNATQIKSKSKKCLKETICLHYLLAHMEPPHPPPTRTPEVSV